jgi:hypothetical protein
VHAAEAARGLPQEEDPKFEEKGENPRFNQATSTARAELIDVRPGLTDQSSEVPTRFTQALQVVSYQQKGNGLVSVRWP